MPMRLLCFFTFLALVVLILPSLVLPLWYNMMKHMEREFDSDFRKIQFDILLEIDKSEKMLVPMKLVASKLAGTLGNNETSSFSKILDKIAPQLFQTLLLVPNLSQVSYIGVDGLLLSFYTEGDQIVAAYSNGSFASNTSNNYTCYIQPVDGGNGRLYGEAVKSKSGLTMTPDNGSVGFGWNQDGDVLILNTAAISTGRGVVSVGVLLKRLTDLFSSIGLHGGTLYLATLEGTVLLEGLPNTRMLVANGSVSLESKVGNINISCNQFREASMFKFEGVQYLLYCSPIQILGMQSVYALAFPYKNGFRHKTTVLLIMLIVMLVCLLLTITTFVLLMVKAARREMRLCSSLIKQMEATQQAERKSMNKSVAFAKASHDVRASLAGIAGLIDLSYPEVVPGSELETNLRQMDACSNDLLGLLNSILDTSKIEAGKMELEEEEFDLAQLVEDVVDLFHPVGMKKNVDVILDPHDGSLLKCSRVRGDRGKLKQILCNLISNAVKFTTKGNVCVRVWIEKPTMETAIIASNRNRYTHYGRLFSKKMETPTTSHPNPNSNCMQFMFEVEDTGKGIPKEARESVFENYVQVKDSGLGQGGTGLGLGIVQSLVRLMSGDIQIVDKLNQENGTCFRFNVLLAASENTHISSSPRMGMRAEGSHVVLLIQNDERGRVSRKFIESLGIKVTVVEQWEKMGSRLRGIKHRVNVSCSRSYGGKEMPLSSMDGTEQTVSSSSWSWRSAFVVIVMDVNAGPFVELCNIVGEFRKGFHSHRGYCNCRVVWVEKPGTHIIHSKDIEEGLVDPNDIIITKPFHGTRLYQMLQLLPEFGGGLEHKSSCSEPQTHEVGRPLSGKRILIVEDNALLLKFAKRTVKQLGASVESCGNGKEAVEVVCHGFKTSSHPYDYILMDCQMPEMDGKEATREIRELEKHCGVHIPIIAITAHTQGSQETREAIEAGMDVCLCKPLKPQHLLEAIRYIHNK